MLLYKAISAIILIVLTSIVSGVGGAFIGFGLMLFVTAFSSLVLGINIDGFYIIGGFVWGFLVGLISGAVLAAIKALLGPSWMKPEYWDRH
jgi:hypothetical protein